MNAAVRSGIDITIELEMVRIAFVERQPDALTRAERLRDRLVGEAARFSDVADLQIGVLERGDEHHDFIAVAAASERTLSRANDLAAAASNVSDLIEVYGKQNLREGIADPGPTTELLYQVAKGRKGDPVLRLYALGKLDDAQLRAAREIEAVVRFVTAGIGMKVQRMAVKSAGDSDAASRMDATERAHHMAQLHASVYVPWTRGRFVSRHMALMLGLVVEGESLSVLKRKHRLRWAKAWEIVDRCLDSYGELRRKWRKENDGKSAR